MKNLTNTMIAWTPPHRTDFSTAGELALVDHPCQGPFKYARDFGASLDYVKKATLPQRKAMLNEVIGRIIKDGFTERQVLSVVQALEEYNDLPDRHG